MPAPKIGRRFFTRPTTPVEAFVPTNLEPTDDSPLWMVRPCPLAREKVFTLALGPTFGGDPVMTARYLLDLWAKSPAGLHYALDPAADTPLDEGRAAPILAHCFVMTRRAILKRAHADGVTVEQAVRRAVNEQLQVTGLDRFYGDAPR